MARLSRKTLPVVTLQGLVTTYAELEPLLTKAELRGRGWILEKLASARKAELSILDRCPDEYDLLALHREMFSEIFEWAGETRQTETVPGVYPYEIRLELHKLFEDLKERLRHAGSDPTLKVVAEIVADVHRRFEWIHPFRDTNGRIGRVFDPYVLWYVFDMGPNLAAGENLGSAPILEYFPDEATEERYFDALRAGDEKNCVPLQEYYKDRIVDAFQEAARSSMNG